MGGVVRRPGDSSGTPPGDKRREQAARLRRRRERPGKGARSQVACGGYRQASRRWDRAARRLVARQVVGVCRLGVVYTSSGRAVLAVCCRPPFAWSLVHLACSRLPRHMLTGDQATCATWRTIRRRARAQRKQHPQEYNSTSSARQRPCPQRPAQPLELAAGRECRPWSARVSGGWVVPQ